MAATGSSNVGASRSGWVAFSDESVHTGKHGGMQAPGVSQPIADSSFGENCVAGPVVQQRSSWVQFDEKPWTPSPPSSASHSPHPLHPPSQVKGLRHSVCSTASFWSSVPPSEGAPSEELSSASMDASSYDLPSPSTEEPPSHSTSPLHSPHSSVCLEDERINMDTLNWTSNIAHTNGQCNSSSSRFASWVTFDDDDGVEEQDYQHASKTSNIRIGHSNSFRLQDTNSNLIVSSIQNQSTNRHILDLTPDGTDSVFDFESPLLNSSTPYTKKNPFLHEDFSNIPPSPINPFSAYFNKTSSNSHETQETPPVSLFNSPAPHIATQKDSFLFFSTSRSLDNESETRTYSSGILQDDLDQYKNMQNSNSDQEPSVPDESENAENDEKIPYEPAHMAPRDGWPMLLRIPEKKNIMSSRHWGPIFVKLSDAGKLRLYYEKGLEKHFKEFQLNTQLEISEHKMQHYEDSRRVHTLILDQVVYKEKRKIQPKVCVVHIPVKEQVVKLGTTDYQDFLSFRYALQEKLAVMSADADAITSPVPYAEEEIQVEVVDSFYGVLSKGDNRILQQLVKTRVSVLAFLTGSPRCQLGLNDLQVKGKEVVSRHDIIPNTTTRWIRLRDCRLHECADESEFTESRTISFEPPSGRRFELLRFQTAYAEKTLPFTLKTVVSVRGAEVELQSWLVMSTGFSSNRDPLMLIPCENVAVRYPVPDIWAKNFRRESVTGEKSLKACFNKGASFGSTSTSGSEPAMRVTLGTAKYEQAFRAVVWRIGRLPDKNSGLGHPHTFFCRLELGSDWEVPHMFQSMVEVEFDMPAASASKTTVRSLSVQDRAELKKWISYKAHYSYQVEIEQKNERLMENQEQAGRCAQQ